MCNCHDNNSKKLADKENNDADYRNLCDYDTSVETRTASLMDLLKRVTEGSPFYKKKFAEAGVDIN
jgi:phenylacetate-CoA ligase